MTQMVQSQRHAEDRHSMAVEQLRARAEEARRRIHQGAGGSGSGP